MQTNSDCQMSQSSECAAEKCGCKFMVFNSVQTFKEYCATRKTYAQAESLNHPVPIFVYNLPLKSSISNSQTQVNDCETIDIRSQFSTVEVSSISNSWNNNRDITIDDTNSDSSVLNKTGLDVSSKVQQEKSNVKIDQQLSKSTQAHSEERNFNNKLEPNIILQNAEMLSQGFLLSELNPQISVSRQVDHVNDQELTLVNMLCPVTIKDNKPNQHLGFSNMLSLTAHLESHESKLTFGNQNDHGYQKQYAATEILNPDSTLCAPVISHSISLESESICPICQKEFRLKKYLKRHYKTHSGIKPAVCSICQQRFSDKYNLKRHIAVHIEKKTHKCKICGKFFRRKDYLDRHIPTHTGEKPHKCNTCGKLFARKDYLGMHIRIHTGEKRHKCNICEKLFAEKQNLIRHVKRRHRLI